MSRLCIVCQIPINGQKQKYCSNACKQKDHYRRIKSQTNTYHSQTLRSLKRKVRLIEMFGGKCQKCGYYANVSAMHFHHKDPSLKSFKLDMRVLSNRTWEVIIEEAKKCELLCSNCHAEQHNPELNIHNIHRIISGAPIEESLGGRGLIQGSLTGNADGNPEPSQMKGQIIRNLEGAETKK